MLDGKSLKIENLSRMKFSFPSIEVGMKLEEERNTADGEQEITPWNRVMQRKLFTHPISFHLI